MQLNNKVYSDRQEKMIASYLGWKQVSGSGARPLYPGDIESDIWLGECKTHTSRCDIYVFDFGVWDKICEEAQSRFKEPVLFVDNGTQRVEHTMCMVKAPDGVDASSVEDLSTHSSLRLKEMTTRAIRYNNQNLMVIPLAVFKAYSEV